jgi:hypothetical protein
MRNKASTVSLNSYVNIQQVIPHSMHIFSTDCFTVGGPDIGKKCVFPFTYNNVVHFGCPVDPEDSSKRWCSTRVDGNGNHVAGQGVYGDCSQGCPIHDDK